MENMRVGVWRVLGFWLLMTLYEYNLIRVFGWMMDCTELFTNYMICDFFKRVTLSKYEITSWESISAFTRKKRIEWNTYKAKNWLYFIPLSVKVISIYLYILCPNLISHTHLTLIDPLIEHVNKWIYDIFIKFYTHVIIVKSIQFET